MNIGLARKKKEPITKIVALSHSGGLDWGDWLKPEASRHLRKFLCTGSRWGVCYFFLVLKCRLQGRNCDGKLTATFFCSLKGIIR